MQARKSWNQGSVQSHVACWSSHGCLFLLSSLALAKVFVFDFLGSPVCRASFAAAVDSCSPLIAAVNFWTETKQRI